MADHVPIDAICGRGKIVKIPVLLKNLAVKIPTHAKIEFPQEEHVLEIKEIKKRVFLTQCKLLHEQGKEGGTLFISGYVRKNIQYASNPISCKRNEIQTNIKSLTVNVPFECSAMINKFSPSPVGPFFNKREEFNFMISTPLPEGYPEKDKLLSDDLSEFCQQSTQYFNELPYCELVKAEIIEIDQSLNRKPGKIIKPSHEKEIHLECTCVSKEEVKKRGKRRKKKRSLFDDGATIRVELPKEKVKVVKTEKECLHCKEKKQEKVTSFEGIFTEMSEKMVLDLTINLLQKQLVKLPE